MGVKRWALSVPLEGFTLADHAELAREAERLGYTDAWSYEVDGVDCFAPLAVVGVATGMRVGTAIANVFTRGPATLAFTLLAALLSAAACGVVPALRASAPDLARLHQGGRGSTPRRAWLRTVLETA